MAFAGAGTRARAILTTHVLKNSALTFARIHSYASISGAAIIPASFVKTFPLLLSLKHRPSFVSAKMEANSRVVLLLSRFVNAIRSIRLPLRKSRQHGTVQFY
jgi:hypothetical protein